MSSFLNGFARFLAWRKIWFIYSVLSKSCLIQTFQYAVLHHLLSYLQISSSQIREDISKCLHLLVQYLSPGISSKGPPSGFTNSPLIFCPDSLGKWCPGGHEQPLVSTFLSGYFVFSLISVLYSWHHHTLVQFSCSVGPEWTFILPLGCGSESQESCDLMGSVPRMET